MVKRLRFVFRNLKLGKRIEIYSEKNNSRSYTKEKLAYENTSLDFYEAVKIWFW